MKWYILWSHWWVFLGGVCVCECFACTYIYISHVCPMPAEAREGVRSSAAGVTEMAVRVTGTKHKSLKLSTAELFPQPQTAF